MRNQKRVHYAESYESHDSGFSSDDSLESRLMNKKKGTSSKKRIDDDDNGKSNKKGRSKRMSSRSDDKSADDATPSKDRIGNDNDELLEEDLEDETLFDLMGDEGEDSDSDSEDDGDDDDGQDASSSSRNNRSKNYFCTRKSEPYCQQNGLPPGSQEIIDEFTSAMNAKLGNMAFKRHARLNWSTDVEAKAECENIWRELMEVTSDLIGRMTQHKSKVFRGFTTKYNVDKLVYYEVFGEMYDAISREKQLKGGSRQKKIALIESSNPDWKDLTDEIRG